MPGAAFRRRLLVERLYQLRKKPLREFTTENLRIMLGQGCSVPLLLPMALDVLERNPLAEGDYYPGDLLQAVMSLKPNDLQGVADLLPRLSALARSSLPLLQTNEMKRLRREVERFLSSTTT